MGLVLPTIEAYQVQHLPIVKAYADKIGLVEVINQLVPTEMGIDPGTIVLGMILDTLSRRSPLYRLAEFFAHQDTVLLLGQAIAPDALNDDTVGRVLERLYDVGTMKIFTACAMCTYQAYGLAKQYVHFDTMSISVYGDYLPPEGLPDQQAPAVPFTMPHGYSKGSCTAILRIIHITPKRGTMLPSQHMLRGGNTMESHLFFSQLVLCALLWLFIILHLPWPQRAVTVLVAPVQPEPLKPTRHRSAEPKPFEGLTHKPHCVLCERDTAHTQSSPAVPPAPMPSTNRRPHTVDTSMHFCPHSDWAYRGWLGLNNLRANGHPSGGPWRQFSCTSCKGYFVETHGTLCHGTQAAVELIVRVLACLAEGLGIRATARVCEVAPNTVLQWLVEAAEQRALFLPLSSVIST